MFYVAIFGGKRLDTVPVKFSELEKEFLKQIGSKEDRPLGYIVRELAFRGLVDYLKDKNIRADLSELESLIEKNKLQNLKSVRGEKINGEIPTRQTKKKVA